MYPSPVGGSYNCWPHGPPRIASVFIIVLSSHLVYYCLLIYFVCLALHWSVLLHLRCASNPGYFATAFGCFQRSLIVNIVGLSESLDSWRGALWCGLPAQSPGSPCLSSGTASNLNARWSSSSLGGVPPKRNLRCQLIQNNTENHSSQYVLISRTWRSSIILVHSVEFFVGRERKVLRICLRDQFLILDRFKCVRQNSIVRSIYWM